MKGKNLFLTALLSIAVGIALVAFKNVINSSTLVTVGGIFFIATGVINMGLFLGSRDKDGKSRQGFFGSAFGWGASAASVLLGLAMLIFHDRFVGLVNFMFAVLIAVTALYQLFLLIFGSRPVQLPSWLFVAPVLLVGASVFLFIPTGVTDAVIMLTTGISFIVFGTAMLIESFFIGNANRQRLKSEKAAPEEKAEEKPTPAKEAEETREPKSLDEAHMTEE